MNWIIVKKVSLDTDLSMVIGYLRERGIVHQIYEETGEQVLAVKNPHIVEPLLQMLDGVAQGTIKFETSEQAPARKRANGTPSLWDQAKASAITGCLILLAVIGALIVHFDSSYHLMHWFTFQPYVVAEFYRVYFMPLAESLQQGQIWRLLTPAFLHFGFFHVLFNTMWIWDLGRRLEFFLGKKLYIIFFLLTAVAANIAQYLWAGPSLFGGMSGFVYALVGFILVSQRLNPHPLTAVATGLLIFMLAWLVICATGVIDNLIGGGVANAAHVGGLLAGIVFAFATTTMVKKRVKALS